MPATRSQRGVPTRKPELLGMDDTPSSTRRRTTRTSAGSPESPSSASQKPKRGRPRKSVAATTFEPESSSESAEDEAKGTIEVLQTEGHTQTSSSLAPASTASPTAKKSPGRPRKSRGKEDVANGSVVSPSRSAAKRISAENAKIDDSGHFEFGGTLGVSAVMIGFPLLMYYMWIGATYYNGKLPLPAKGQSVADFLQEMGRMVYQGAFPSLKAWAMYWSFFVFEAACYILLPGVTAYGKPLPHEGGKKLAYHCSAMWSFYTTIAVAAGLHFSGLFRLDNLLDEFGPIMSVAIISGVLISVVAYISAVQRGATHRMTGHVVYDFFMGAELNPRMFGILDFKMFFEVRIPWYMLFLTSASAAARQYERYGYVAPEVWFLVMAHYLYANACSKGEDLIAPTWDMYYEKWGFMLIFWNLAGVPLSYCHCTIYLANHHPSVYAHSTLAMVLLFVAYLFMYWVWDTTNSQKNRFRQKEGFVPRRTFPQLPWQTIKNPRTIPTKTGDALLADGWYKYARKLHYTCDAFFALSWAGVTGFQSPFPWFYPLFFLAMITHRASRDIQRCRERYGEAWLQYEKLVPYLFIPGVY